LYLGFFLTRSMWACYFSVLHNKNDFFIKLKYCTYFACYSIMLFHRTRIISIHLMHVMEPVITRMEKWNENELVFCLVFNKQCHWWSWIFYVGYLLLSFILEFLHPWKKNWWKVWNENELVFCLVFNKQCHWWSHEKL